MIRFSLIIVWIFTDSFTCLKPSVNHYSLWFLASDQHRKKKRWRKSWILWKTTFTTNVCLSSFLMTNPEYFLLCCNHFCYDTMLVLWSLYKLWKHEQIVNKWGTQGRNPVVTVGWFGQTIHVMGRNWMDSESQKSFNKRYSEETERIEFHL